MVLIKRVMLAAVMSLLSEGAIAGEAVAPSPDKEAVVQQVQGEHSAPIADAAGPETR